MMAFWFEGRGDKKRKRKDEGATGSAKERLSVN